jgi:hypothetical protein
MRQERMFVAVLAVWVLALGIAVRAHSTSGGIPAAALQAAVARPAPPPAPPANADCLVCHEDLTRADGRSVSVKAAVFEKSVHGPLSCVDCHQDLARPTDMPHPDKLAKVDCAACHADDVAKYTASVHASARAKGTEVAASCVDCHGTHDIRPRTDPESRTHHLRIAATCARCHGDAETIRKGGIPSDVTKFFADSIHGKALSKGGLVVAPTCSDCHEAHDIRGKRDPESHVTRQHVAATCAKCHEGIGRQFTASTHGQHVDAGDPKAPVCQTCHTAHAIQRAENQAWQLAVVGQCGTCHGEKIGTFRDTFHGRVTTLGFRSVASCADCHGAHEILPAANPASTISAARLVATCARCHPGANENFVRYDPHPNYRDYHRNRAMWWAGRFYTVIISGCFGFFGLHSLLWLGRSWKDRKEHR